MARYIYQDVAQNEYGNVKEGVTITVKLAGGDTLATIYSAVSGGSAISGSQVTSGSDGTFSFYVDTDDYDPSQRFKISASLAGSTAQDDKDYIQIIPYWPDDTAFGAGWNGDTDYAPTKNAVYDEINGLSGLKTTLDALDGPMIGNGDGTYDVVDNLRNLSQYSDFPTAISTIGATPTLLIIDADISLSSNETVPSTLYLQFVPGAIITVNNTYTLTIYSPENILASPRQQILSLTGDLAFSVAGTIHPGWIGTPVDGTTDTSTYWTAINTAMVAGSTLELLPNADYALESGITFSKKIVINGNKSKFTVESGVGNAQYITCSAANSVVRGIEIDGTDNHADVTGDNDFLDTEPDGGDSYDNNDRKSLKISGNDSLVENCVFTDGVYALEVTSSDVMVLNNHFNNTIIDNNDSHANYHAAIALDGANKVLVDGNRISGHGQGILVRGSSTECKLVNNDIASTSDNGIYISSGDRCIVSNNYVEGHVGSGIKVRGSFNTVDSNVVNCSITGGADGTGIKITSDGAGQDGSGIITGNIIRGDSVVGIGFEGDNSFDFEGPIIEGNNIYWNASQSQTCLGMRIVTNQITKGGIISNNLVANPGDSVLRLWANTGEYFDGLVIENNVAIGSDDDAFDFIRVKNSTIANNIIKNGAASTSALYMSDCDNNLVTNNNFGDDQGTPTQEYGIEEDTGCEENKFINNELEGNTSNRIVLVDTDSTVRTERVYTATLSANATAYRGEARTYILQASGAARNLDPQSGIWPRGYLITVVSTGGSYNVVFDSGDIGVAVTPGTVCSFIYNGSAWQQVHAVT